MNQALSLSMHLLYALRIIPSVASGSALGVELPTDGFYDWLELCTLVTFLICLLTIMNYGISNL